MQVELMNIAKKGLCIVISGLEFTENNKIDLSRFIMKTGNFHNLAFFHKFFFISWDITRSVTIYTR